jgi:phospholipid/cholesterol/gamma-HCH transport system substrate-binding protein
MNEPVNKRAIGVGAFIIIGLLFLVGGVMTVGNLHSTFQKKITVSTVFDDVNGLQSGNNIWFSGVKIGTVKKMEFYGNSKVKVIMSINTESKEYVRKDALVKIGSDGLIGNTILIIYGGTSAITEVEDGDTLSNEDFLSTEDIMNTFQENNLNILTFTNKLANGEGTIGKLFMSDSIYNNIAATTISLQKASLNAQTLIASLANFTAKMNKDGSLANDLVSDTLLFKSITAMVGQLNSVADTAAIFINNLKVASKNPNSPVGMLLQDEQAGAQLKTTIANLESGSQKLDANLEALQHSFLLRKYFKKKEKNKAK